MSVKSQIEAHYGNDDIYSRIIQALRDAGIEPGTATVHDLAPIDQFHTGGLPATRALAERIEVTQASRVFDAGCGIGGAARFLADTYGCNVVGMDLSPEFIDAAGPLNELLGLSGQVVCFTGDITDTGMESSSFDVVWSQNVLMNVEDKAAALAEAYRLLIPGGSFVFQAVMQDNPGERIYPVPWAPGPEIEFLSTPEDFKRMAAEAGFTVTGWDEARGKSPLPPPPPAPSLTFSVIMRYPDFGQLLKNYLATAEKGLVVPVVGVLTK